MRVAEALAATLVDRGVSAVFALMSDEVSHLIVELERLGVAVYGTRHEAAAIGMADGYARISGSVGVAIVGRGPGLSNALTAITCAARSDSSVVVLAGDGAAGVLDPEAAVAARRQPKYVDQVGMLRAVGVEAVTLASPDAAVADIGAVLDAASAGRTVVANLPADLLRAPWHTPLAGDQVRPSVGFTARPDVPPPDPRQVHELADLLESSFAQRPLLLAGRGAVRAGAVPALLAVGERIGAVMGSTLLARSIFAGQAFDIGVVGSFASPVAAELVTGADAVLAFGTSLNPYTTLGGDLLGRATVVQVDRDPAAFGRFRAVDLAIHGDVAAVASALDAELSTRGHARAGYRTAAVGAQLAAAAPPPFTDMSEADRIDPRIAMLAFDAALPPDRILVIDPGHHLSWSGALLSVRDPESFIFAGASGAIGSAPGIALGAAVAAPDRVTVLEVGDGGLVMTLGDLSTAVQYGLRMAVLVTNDAAFGTEVHLLRAAGLPDTAALYPDVDIAAVARALGADVVTVRDEPGLAAAAGRLREIHGPVVVDCKVTRQARGDWVDFRARDSVPAAGR